MPTRRTGALAAAVALVAAGCGASRGPADALDGAAPQPAPRPSAEAVGHAGHAGERALCTVLPTTVVGDLIGTGAALDASGDGTQCTWRGGAPVTGGAADLAADGPILQGVLLDAGAFDAGRPVPGDPSVQSVAEVGGVGDEAFIVRVGDGAPTTLYVRDGQRTLSLWLDGVSLTPEGTERSLARTASLLLNLA